MMHLPALYHWSPTDRRVEITQCGLTPYQPGHVLIDGKQLGFPYICFSPTPSAAWGLSGDMDWGTEIESWDLWMVRLIEGDEVQIRSDFGPVVREVRTFNAIPPDRLWYVATREPKVAVEIEKPPKPKRKRKARKKK